MYICIQHVHTTIIIYVTPFLVTLQVYIYVWLHKVVMSQSPPVKGFNYLDDFSNESLPEQECACSPHSVVHRACLKCQFTHYSTPPFTSNIYIFAPHNCTYTLSHVFKQLYDYMSTIYMSFRFNSEPDHFYYGGNGPEKRQLCVCERVGGTCVWEGRR